MEINSPNDKYRIAQIIKKYPLTTLHVAFSLTKLNYFLIYITPKSNLTITVENEKYLKEKEMICSINHINISQFIEYFEDKVNNYIVTDYLDGPSLESEIKTKGFIPEDRAKKLSKQIIDALVYLHVNNFAHGSIHPDNILINYSNGKEIIRLDNIMNIILNGRTEIIKNFKNPNNWVPPEVLSGEICYGVHLDDWAVGLLIFYMLSGFHPYDNIPESNLLLHIKEKSLIKPEKMSTTAFSLIEKMLCPNPVRRFSSMQAQPHFWFVQSDTEMPMMSHTWFASSPVGKSFRSNDFNSDKIKSSSPSKYNFNPSELLPPSSFE